MNDAQLEGFDRRRCQGAEVPSGAMPISRVAGRGLRPGLDLTHTAGLVGDLDGLADHDPTAGPPPQLNRLR